MTPIKPISKPFVTYRDETQLAQCQRHNVYKEPGNVKNTLLEREITHNKIVCYPNSFT